MDNSSYDGGMAQNPYANAAASPPTNYNRFDSRNRQNNCNFNGTIGGQKINNNPMAPRCQQGIMSGPRNSMQKSVQNGHDGRVHEVQQRARPYPPSLFQPPTENFFASESLENAIAAAECPQALQITFAEISRSLSAFSLNDLSLTSYFRFVFRKSFGGYGNGEGEFNMPQGLCLGDDDEIIVAGRRI